MAAKKLNIMVDIKESIVMPSTGTRLNKNASHKIIGSTILNILL